MSELHEHLLELRRKKGITQRELAEHLNVSQISLSYWETGKREPSLDVVRKLAEYYNTSIDYLVGSQAITLELDSHSKDSYARICKYYETLLNSYNNSQKNIYSEKLFHLCDMLNEDAVKELVNHAIELLQNTSNRSENFTQERD